MVEQPLVSVIITAYNCLPLVQKCLETVFQQDISDLGRKEIVVVDDGSTDGTWDWLQSIAPEHPDMKLVHLNDLGVAKARNAGLEAATGKYIRFVDGDDKLCDNSLRALLTPMLKDPVDLVVGAFCRRVGDNVTLRNAGGETKRCTVEEYLAFMTRYATSYYVGAVWNKLFRRDLIMQHDIRYQSGMYYGEDFLFATTYLAHCSHVHTVSDPVYVYYLNPKGMTMRQIKSVFTHPVKNIRLKAGLYRSYKNLFRTLGLYDKYKYKIWQYPIQVNMDN